MRKTTLRVKFKFTNFSVPNFITLNYNRWLFNLVTVRNFSVQDLQRTELKMSCEESTDSEEEVLVFAEFEESVNIKNYRAIHVLGITEKHPIIQMDETIFTGQLESSLGTYMFFTKDHAPQSADPLFDKLPKENFKYVCKGNKYLNMKHTYITPKDGTEQAISHQLQQAEIELVPASFTTVHEAIEAFKKEWEPITQETNIKTTNSLPCDQDMTDLSKS